jgi:hypothetical protein
MAGHENRAHAYLSASGSERWMNCTPSAAFESQFEKKSSTYADEGTLAHEFAEIQLQVALGHITKVAGEIDFEKLRKHDLYYADMENEVAEYVNVCLEIYNNLKTQSGWAQAKTEHKVSLNDYIKEGFGTIDFSAFNDNVLHIADLKFGKGVIVSAHENSQLKLYALGALRWARLYTNVEIVKMTICMPRLEIVSTYEVTADELITWGEKDVREKATLAFEGKGEFNPGHWCKWCAGKARCKAIAEVKLSEAKADFAMHPEKVSPPTLHVLNTLSDDEMVKIYAAKKQIEDWLESVKAYMVEQAEVHGKIWPGYKLVDGIGRRGWTSEEDAAKVLKKQGLKVADIYVKKLVGIGVAEKLIGKDRFNEVAKAVIVKKFAAKSLVQDTVNRMSSSSAKADFS